MIFRTTIKRHAFDRIFHRRRLYVLNYHRLSGPGESASDDFRTLTPVEQFRSNIVRLAERYRFVAVHDWLTNPALHGQDGHYVAVTFDDGHESVFEHALPVLREFRVPATLFVNSGYWEGSRRLCWSNSEGEEHLVVDDRDTTLTEAIRMARNTQDKRLYRTMTQLVEERAAQSERIGHGYLTFDSLKAERSELISIGMHGHLHHRHAMFDRVWQANNVRVNFKKLKTLKNFVPLFAFPFGTAKDIDSESISLCEEFGIVPVFHNGGYNVAPGSGVRRIPGDGRDAIQLIESQSPFLHKYDVHQGQSGSYIPTEIKK